MAAPDTVSKRDLQALQKQVDDLTKRYEKFVADLNNALQNAKDNDDRIEALVEALKKKVDSAGR